MLFAEIRVGNKKVIVVEIPMLIAEKIHLQGMEGWSECERIPCQNTNTDECNSWVFAEIRVGNTKGGLCCSTAKKSHLQGMRGWSESEGISYQTPVLKKFLSS